MRQLSKNQSSVLLLSIKPKYTSQIFDGSKVVELRRTRPRIAEGQIVLIYESSPTMALVGFGLVESVIASTPRQLWIDVGRQSGLTKQEFDAYFRGASIGFGIRFSKVHSFNDPVALDVLKEKWENFHPPQIYRYITRKELKKVSNERRKLQIALSA